MMPGTFLFLKRFYVFISERDRKHKYEWGGGRWQREGQVAKGKAGSPLSRQLRAPGSLPELKADPS